MKEDLENIEKVISNVENIEISKIKELLQDFFKKHVTRNRIEDFIGDYPTFLEPVYLGKNVKLGDDVLVGPNVFIGENSQIGDYVEISNTIIFDNVKIGENFKLENCIVAKNSSFDFSNMLAKNCVLMGQADSKENLKKVPF